MAQKKEINSSEDAGESVQQTPDLTTGRAESEERLASGNVRKGQAETESEVNPSGE